MCTLRQGLPRCRVQPGRRHRPPRPLPEAGPLGLEPSQWVQLTAEVVREPLRDLHPSAATPPSVERHVPPQVGEGPAADIGRDTPLAVIRARMGQRRDEHEHGEVPAQRGRGFGDALGERHLDADLADVPYQVLDTLLQEPHRPDIRGECPPQGDHVVDVLVRHRQMGRISGSASASGSMRGSPVDLGDPPPRRVRCKQERRSTMRTGSEPRTARSALRARFWLSLWGLVWALFGTVAFAIAGRNGWAIACGVLLLIVTIDLAVVLRHIRQGPRYQPGRDIPPYRPPDERP
ncbi:hypothetical protein HDC93_002498 [Streptomyces sp. AK010]|nr:hypothetical protein [Streptomyces sp. AK010]